MIDHVIECAECGHLHFDAKALKYTECPLRPAGCDCDGQDDPDEWAYGHDCEA